MSRRRLRREPPGARFPRVSGDEPLPPFYVVGYIMFSPRERG